MLHILNRGHSPLCSNKDPVFHNIYVVFGFCVSVFVMHAKEGMHIMTGTQCKDPHTFWCWRSRYLTTPQPKRESQSWSKSDHHGDDEKKGRYMDLGDFPGLLLLVLIIDILLLPAYCSYRVSSFAAATVLARCHLWLLNIITAIYTNMILWHIFCWLQYALSFQRRRNTLFWAVEG